VFRYQAVDTGTKRGSGMLRRIVLLLIVLSSGSIYGQPKDEPWQHLTLLKSTRQDVLKLLGPSSSSCDCIYDTPDQILSMIYSSGGPCEPGIRGWNVPPNTLVGMLVTPKTKRTLAEWGIKVENYQRREDPFTLGNVLYSREADGVTILVVDGLVTRFEYGPKTNDRGLRCPDPKPVATPEAGLAMYPLGRLDMYGDLRFDDEKSRLDMLAHELLLKPDTRGYIIVYAGRRAHVAEAQTRANRAKRYLTRTFDIESSRIIAVDGGFREQLMVELWFGSRAVAAPTPSPTIRPSQVTIIR